MTTSQISPKRSSADSHFQLRAVDAGVAFGSDIVLQGITFTVRQGEFIGLIGQNGSGKTTLLRMLLGLLKPTQGIAERSKETAVGYVPQRGNLYNGIVPMSALEVAALGSRGDTTAARQALEKVGMNEHERRNFSELSGGQQQRIVIAKALAGGADVLLLDEPTTGVDEESQKEFYAMIEKIHSEKRTIIMVSHDIDSVVKSVSRVICLNRTVIYDGPPEKFDADRHLRREHDLHLHTGESHD